LQTGVSTEREAFYTEFIKILFLLKQSKVLNIHIYKTSVYNTESFDKDVLGFLRQRFNSVTSSVENILQNDLLPRREFDNYRIIYDNLKCFERYSRSIDLDFKSFVEDIDSNLNRELDDFQSIASKPDCTIVNLSKNLISMKLFAENLPSLNEAINEKKKFLLITSIIINQKKELHCQN
jgi:hypothetical protein